MDTDIENTPRKRSAQDDDDFDYIAGLDGEIPKKRRNRNNNLKAPRRRQIANDTVASDDDQDGVGEALLQDQTSVPGRVVAVEMENFMCHSFLKLNFDVDHANCFFVGGPNGSGKSALFAALNIGLGGKGSHNDRGNSLKGYIKEGTNKAKIRITLANTGQGAMPDYGTRIIIERVITLNSGGTYTIKSLGGAGRSRREEVVSHKKSDIDKILNRFGIQLANPIFWMSQDRCRQFLNVAKPEALFEIFAKATELEYTEATYSKVEEVMGEVRRGMDVLKKKARASKEEREKLLKNREKWEALQHQQRLLDELGWFLTWAPVKQAHHEMDITNHKIKEAEAQIASIGQKVIQKRATCQEHQRLQNAGRDGYEEKQREVTQIKEQFQDKREVRKQYRDQLFAARGREKEIQKDIELRKMNLRRAQGKLEELRNNSTQDLRRRRFREAKQKVDEGTDQLSELIAKRDEKKQERVGALGDFEAIRKDFEQKNVELRDLDLRIGRLTDHKKRMEQISRDELGKYGNHTKHVLELIRRNRNQFVQEPVGPIGMHVHVRDDRWAFPVEKAVRDVLCHYVVDNAKDDRLLKQLVRQHLPNVQLSTFVTRFLPRHDTSKFAPDQRFMTVERMIDVDSDVAFNLLVDKCSIESCILLERDDEARKVMDGNCPVGAKGCFTMSGAKVQGRSAQGGFYRFFPDHTDRVAQFLIASKAGDSAKIDVELQRLRDSQPEIKEASASLRRQFSIASETKQEIERELDSLVKQCRVCEISIRENKRFVESYDGDEDEDAGEENLKKSIAVHEQSIQEKELELAGIEEEREQIEVEVSEAEEAIRDLKEQHDVLERELRPFTEAQSMNEEAQQKAMHQIQVLERNEQQLKMALEEMEASRIEHSRAFDEAKKQASEDCQLLITPEGFDVPPDLASLPDPHRVRQDYDELCHMIEATERTLPPLNEINAALTRNAQQSREHSDVEKRLQAVHEAMERALHIRKEKFPVMRHAITIRLKDTFSRLMSIRGMQGTVNIDFDKRLLEIPVKPKGQNSNVQDHKGLSGGERSYLTACFVMSLWEIMESPFRCMDEFDVFMDSCNRKIIMDLIIDFTTNKYSHSQFILFTPQGITELKLNPRVKIFEMLKVQPTSVAAAE